MGTGDIFFFLRLGLYLVGFGITFRCPSEDHTTLNNVIDVGHVIQFNDGTSERA